MHEQNIRKERDRQKDRQRDSGTDRHTGRGGERRKHEQKHTHTHIELPSVQKGCRERNKTREIVKERE